MNKSKTTIARALGLLSFTVLLTSCITSIKPIYNDREKAKAEKTVAQFHQLHNEGKFEEIYPLLDEVTRAEVTKDAFVAAEKGVTAEWGKVQSARLSAAKVVPSFPIQVILVYDTKFEKGDGQERIVLNIRGDEARMLHYQTERFDKPESAK